MTNLINSNPIQSSKNPRFVEFVDKLKNKFFTKIVLF